MSRLRGAAVRRDAILKAGDRSPRARIRAAAGFHKAGEVRGHKLSFTIGSDRFNLASGGAIAPTQAAFNLYVLHDPGWKPDLQQ